MKIVLLSILLPILCSCSLYESDGRKFLEANAGTPDWIGAQADFVGCEHTPPTLHWMLLDRQPLADTYVLEGDDYQLRVVPTQDQSFNCYFQFNSASEMYEKSAAAIDMTMFQLQSPPKPRSH